MEARDAAAEPGTYPLIIYSHPSGAHRRAATFLCTHRSSHGHVVAALDHREDETPERKIANRVPDARLDPTRARRGVDVIAHGP